MFTNPEELQDNTVNISCSSPVPSIVSNSSVTDPRLPALQTVFDPVGLGQVLNQVVPAEWGKAKDLKIQLLQYHRASRCTLSICWQTTTGSRELIAKVYAADRSDVYRAMKQITESGFGAEAEFAVPRPLAYVPEQNLLLLEKVPGVLATEVFLTGNETERVHAAERCALWLANFHRRGPRLGPVFTITTDLLESWAQRLAKRAEQVLAKAVLLSTGLQNCTRKNGTIQPSACHGTYCHYQIVLNDNQTVTLDWDGHCLADPTLDVARFMIILQQLALTSQASLNALNATCQVFYSTYLAASRFHIAQQLPFYKAALYLKHAKDFAKRDAVRIELVETMLDEGLRILTEEVEH